MSNISFTDMKLSPNTKYVLFKVQKDCQISGNLFVKQSNESGKFIAATEYDFMITGGLLYSTTNRLSYYILDDDLYVCFKTSLSYVTVIIEMSGETSHVLPLIKDTTQQTKYNFLASKPIVFSVPKQYYVKAIKQPDILYMVIATENETRHCTCDFETQTVSTLPAGVTSSFTDNGDLDLTTNLDNGMTVMFNYYFRA